MATANRSDLWVQPSGDRWSQPSPSEQRFFEEHDTELPRHSWTTETELGLEPDMDAEPASPKRATAARVAGTIGVIAVLALALAAFAPRMPLVASKLALLANHLELPWDPKLAPGPEPLPLERAPASSRSTPVAAGADSGSSEPVPAVQALPIEPAPADVVETPLAAEPIEAPVSSEPVASEPRQSVSEPTQAVSEPASSREPPLTPEEITRREERYEQWLKSEGLQRIQ